MPRTDHPLNCYHCVSHVVGRRAVFGPDEKHHFLLFLHEYAPFCRVRVLSYCFKEDHFHLLLEVPRRPDSLPGPDQIVHDLRRLSARTLPDLVARRFADLRAAADPSALQVYLATFHARMYDLSAFMKVLKQRFTQWYNARHGRTGTLWEERFRSAVVDGREEAQAIMLAHLNANALPRALRRRRFHADQITPPPSKPADRAACRPTASADPGAGRPPNPIRYLAE